jgi:transcription antitermination factor NusG
MSQRWYVIKTKPQCEYLAAAALEREDFRLYFPRVRSPRPQRGHDDLPLFPGYLFIYHDVENEEPPAVGRLPGLLGWVRFNGHAPPVPDDVVAAIQRRVEAINRGGGLWTRFGAGDKVMVSSGKLESLAEVVEDSASPHSKVRVLLELMGRAISAEVPWHTLRPARGGVRRNERRTRGRGRWTRGSGPRAAVSASG